jgi:hypothetical protein
MSFALTAIFILHYSNKVLQCAHLHRIQSCVSYMRSMMSKVVSLIARQLIAAQLQQRAALAWQSQLQLVNRTIRYALPSPSSLMVQCHPRWRIFFGAPICAQIGCCCSTAATQGAVPAWWLQVQFVIITFNISSQAVAVTLLLLLLTSSRCLRVEEGAYRGWRDPLLRFET